MPLADIGPPYRFLHAGPQCIRAGLSPFIHVVSVSTGLTHWGDMDFEYLNFGSLEDGDELARIALTDDPEHQQDPNFTFGVGFSKTGPGAKAPDVVQTLSWIGTHIQVGVIEPLLPFL